LTATAQACYNAADFGEFRPEGIRREPGPLHGMARRHMKTFQFDPSQTFVEVRQLMAILNRAEHVRHVAKLTWLDGNQVDQMLTFRYDKLAERFCHEIDKEGINVEIVSSLLNNIPVRVDVEEEKPRRKR
jgi:hypothetical protein